MIIGARYHSIIFGINNLIPVIALNYEQREKHTETKLPRLRNHHKIGGGSGLGAAFVQNHIAHVGFVSAVCVYNKLVCHHFRFFCHRLRK